MTCPSCGGNGCNACDETGEIDGPPLRFFEDDGEEDDIYDEEEDLLDDEENE